MTDMPIYYASELNPDTCLNIAMFLFATRRNSKLTITEAAVRTGLSVKDVDELETQAGQYDLQNREAVGFIQEKLPMSAKSLKRMPKTLAGRYFEG